MAVVGQHGAHTGPLHYLGDHLRVGRHHQLLDQTEVHDVLNHPGDERLTGQQLERFIGETGRAKTSRNDTQDAHHER